MFEELADYYQRKSGQEIDFIVDKRIACEVKETPHPGDRTTLHNRAAYLHLEETWLVGKTPPGEEWRDFVWAGQVF